MSLSLHNKTILVADDMPMNLLIMKEVLKVYEATVLTAANGKEVLEILGNRTVDIVLMDLQMPEMDGFEAAKAIRLSNASYNDVPIIAVTSETASEEIAKCFAAGMNDYTTKPVAPEAFYKKLIALLFKGAEANSKSINTSPASATFDLTYLKQVTNGEKDNLMLIVDNLKQNAPLLLQQATELMDKEVWCEMAANLHKLKGLTALFCMQNTTKILIEAEAETKTTTPSVEVLTKKLRELSIQMPGLIQQISEEAIAS